MRVSSEVDDPMAHVSPRAPEPTLSGGLTVCIINHNGERYLERSVGAAVAHAETPAEIIVVDDASQDRSIAILQEQFPSVHVVRMAANLGPAAARNVGLREAATDRVLFVDNDVYLTPDCVRRLVEALDQHGGAAIAVPRVVYENNPGLVQFDGAESHFIGLQIVEGDHPVQGSSRETRPIGSLISACFLLDRKRLSPPEEFDDSFFIYQEDHDFGIRVRGRGWEILSVPTALASHGEGTANLSLRALGGYSRRRVFCHIRNRWQLILKNYSARSLVLLAPVLLVYEVFQLGLVVKKGWTGEWGRAVLWMLGHGRLVLAKRRLFQSRRGLGDRAILRGGSIPFRSELIPGQLERAGKSLLDRICGLYWSGVQRAL